MLETAYMDVGNGGVNPLPGERLFCLENIYGIVLLYDDAHTMQSLLCHLRISVRSYGMCFCTL